MKVLALLMLLVGPALAEPPEFDPHVVRAFVTIDCDRVLQITAVDLAGNVVIFTEESMKNGPRTLAQAAESIKENGTELHVEYIEIQLRASCKEA